MKDLIKNMYILTEKREKNLISQKRFCDLIIPGIIALHHLVNDDENPVDSIGE